MVTNDIGLLARPANLVTATYDNRFYPNAKYIHSFGTSFKSMTSAYSVPCINAVLVAEHELSLNIKEVSNNNSRRIAIYKNGAVNSAPWCASFVSYVYGQGQSASNSKTFGYDASTQSIKRQAIDANCYAKKNTGYMPRVGDLAMWTKNSWQGHIGIVTKVYEDGSFDVIEGNSSNNKVEKIHYKSQNDVGKYFDGFVKMNEWTSGSKVTYKA